MVSFLNRHSLILAGLVIKTLFHSRNQEIDPSIELLGFDPTQDPKPGLSRSAWHGIRNSSLSLKTFGVGEDKNNSKYNQPKTRIRTILVLWVPKRPHNLLGRLMLIKDSTYT